MEEKLKQQEKPKVEEKVKKGRPQEESYEMLIRILGYDLPGSKNIYSALTRIKGISWAISNAICIKLNYSRKTKISELSKDDIAKIENFLKNITLPDYMKNRRTDPETGATTHKYGTDLDIARDFDIKRMKKIKSYKGIRHNSKQPVRGQRTRSHFRSKGRATGMGIKKKPASPAGGAKK